MPPAIHFGSGLLFLSLGFGYHAAPFNESTASRSHQMKAVTLQSYSGPEAVAIADVDPPSIGPERRPRER